MPGGDESAEVRLGMNIKKVVQFIQATFNNYKQWLIAGILLAVLVSLLFSLFSQFQSPNLSATPKGMTAIEYSTFLSQVRAGNVLAASMRDQEIEALLPRPVSRDQNATATQAKLTPKQREAVIATLKLRLAKRGWRSSA
jgi:hypothetical protein